MFDTDELVINMGPQHPSTHGVLRVVLRLDGERVVDADVVIGYLHRGIEKLCENRDWTQIVLLTDRMDYVAAATNNLGYCETVEKLLSLEVPRRAQLHPHHPVRAAAHREPSRVARHARDGHRRRHGVPVLPPRAGAGARPVRGVLRRAPHLQLRCASAGCRRTCPPAWDRKVRAFCDIMDEKVLEYETLLTQNRIWLERTRDIGVISAADAIAIGLSGPALRASGVKRDIRKDEPYAAYDEFAFDIPLGAKGDTYDRYLVRLEEFRQSTRIIRQALDGLPEGPIIGKVPRLIKPPAGETYHAIESPKGEIGYLHRQRREIALPVPLPRAAALLLQPAGPAAALHRPHGRRRRRADRHDRHRPGRGGPVSSMIASLLVPLFLIVIILVGVLTTVAYLVLLERKVQAWVQVRLGPMRVGPHGVLQPVADIIKLIIKEDITPVRVDKVVYTLAPIIVMVPALIAFAVIPFGAGTTIFGTSVPLYVADINVGLLYIVSVASIGVYGIILGGWSSNSKYPLLASLRASAQLICVRSGRHDDPGQHDRDRGLAQHGADRRGPAADGVVVPLRPARRVRHLPDRRPRRDQPRAVRPARGGVGVGGRVPHRVLGDALRAVLPRRVRQHDRRRVRGDDAVPRRVAAAVPQRRGPRVPRLGAGLGLVPAEGVPVPLPVPVDPRDAAALPLRPVDARRAGRC